MLIVIKYGNYHIINKKSIRVMKYVLSKKGKRKVQGVPHSQAPAHLRHEEEEEMYAACTSEYMD